MVAILCASLTRSSIRSTVSCASARWATGLSRTTREDAKRNSQTLTRLINRKPQTETPSRPPPDPLQTPSGTPQTLRLLIDRKCETSNGDPLQTPSRLSDF
eukprot:2407947-Pyramimonas_sp.AAC.3